MSEVKGKAVQRKIKGRNNHDTISQLLELVNKESGWTLKKVNTGLPNNLEVYLERSTKQGESVKVADKEGANYGEKVESTEVKEEEPTEKDVAKESEKVKPKTTRSRSTKK